MRESPGNFTPHEHRTHTRAVIEIRRKILQAYRLTEEKVTLPPYLQRELSPLFCRALGSEKWRSRRDGWRTQPLDSEESASMDTLALEMMHRYGEAFYLRETARDCAIRDNSATGADRKFYRENTHRVHLVESYMGHLTNSIQASLEQRTNGDTVAALKIHSHVIASAVEACKAKGMQQALILPSCTDMPHADDCVARIKQHTSNHAELLKKAYRDANREKVLSDATFAARLAARKTGQQPRGLNSDTSLS